MKKKLFSILILVICLSLLTGCMCKHETWNEADCVTPKTCAECGETEGAPLGHTWEAATCETPKTCEICGVTEGEALGHTWIDATCEAPKTCESCHLTEGEALEHIWEEATTEAPKTCTLCALTEGERIVTDPRFTTASTKEIQGLWSTTLTITGVEAGLPDYTDYLATMHMQFNFTNTGDLIVEVDIPDAVGFYENMVALSAKMTYDQLASAGMDKEAVDTLLKDQFGMDMDTYIRSLMTQEVVNQLIAQFSAQINKQGVYYVSNGILYTGDTWHSEILEEPHTLSGNTLILDNMNAALRDMGWNQEVVFTRVTE